MKFILLSLCMYLPWLTACETKVTTNDNCGDSYIDPGEDCDGSTLPARDCMALGYYQQNGPLTCTSECTLDVSGCIGQCGDSQIQTNFGEQCDGVNLDGKTCELLGLRGGTLACDAFCRFDTSACQEQAVCGDGTIQSPLEDCEQNLLGDSTCQTLGFYGGALACGTDCRFDTTACATFGRCGDGSLQQMYGEQCEGVNLDGKTCENLNYYGGTLTCTDGCRFDLTDCESHGNCGDGEIQEAAGETCDGVNFGGKTCGTLGYYGGTLTCTDGCRLDLADCESHGNCGDGEIQLMEDEECDGVNLAGQSCENLNYHGGTLTCTDGCRFDLTDCENAGRCGDGIIQEAAGETCDGDDFGGDTCESLGYHGGAPLCSEHCLADFSPCEATGSCGDGIIQEAAGETCDGLNLDGQSCTGLGYNGGTLTCDANCLLDLTPCQVTGRCGDGVIQSAYEETCDGLNLDGQSCSGLGYYGGDLACSSDCSLNLAPCIAEGRCGDGEIQSDHGESCDGTNLNELDCESFSMNPLGTLACSSSCQFVLSGCNAICGDGTVDPVYEDCESGQLEGQTCRSQGYFTGALGCDGTCHFDLDPCHDVVQIAAGYDFVCARLDDGTVKCWGGNSNGQLGNGTSTPQSTPGPVTGLAGATDLAAGTLHACAILSSGELKCWGRNNSGQLGTDNKTSSNTPVQVSGLTDVIDVSGNYYHSCAVKSDGTVWCWGNNQYGRLGDGSTTERLVPTQVLDVTGAEEVACGQMHSCARITDGTIRCWGNNVSGQLGNGTVTQSLTAVMVNTITTATRIVAGDDYTCALLADQSVWCWGENYNRQMGDGTQTDRLSPGVVSGVSNAVSVAAGAYHVCVALASGAMKCWGSNMYGGIGDGTTTTATTPTPVLNITDATQATAGYSLSCATNASGASVRCWGYNNFGQLGNGTTTDSSTPVLVSP